MTTEGTKGSDSGTGGWKSEQNLGRTSWVISKEGSGQSWKWTRPFLTPFLQVGVRFVAWDVGVTNLQHQDWCWCAIAPPHKCSPSKKACFLAQMMVLVTGIGGYMGNAKWGGDEFSQSSQNKTTEFCHWSPRCNTRVTSGRAGEHLLSQMPWCVVLGFDNRCFKINKK